MKKAMLGLFIITMLGSCGDGNKKNSDKNADTTVNSSGTNPTIDTGGYMGMDTMRNVTPFDTLHRDTMRKETGRRDTTKRRK